MDGSTNSLDDVSAESSTEFPDRLSLMEVRLQAQEDEITLLKSSLADALRKLRLHDQQIPLLKQQLIAVNPAAARVLNQSCYVDGFTKPCRLSSSSLDGFHHTSNSHISNTAENGEGGAKTISSHKPSTCDRCAQTEPWIPNHETVPLALTQAAQILSLEDALPESIPFADETLIKLRREEEDVDEVESGKDQTWSSIVEDAIQPTTIRTLQKQLSKGSEDSQGSCPQTPTSSSPAPPKEPTSNPHGGLLSPIREGEKMLCVDP